MKLLPLKGYKSLKALNAFHTLLLGLKMLPAHVMTDYESFFGAFKEKTDAEKETLIREAVLFVPLENEEVESLLSFVCDKNGVPYGPHSIKNLTPDMIHEAIVAVCIEIGKIKITLLSEEEKKKSLSGESIQDELT